MDWCRLSTSFYLDIALLRAGESAEVLFLRCLAYAGAQESGGVIPNEVIPMLTPTKTKARVDALVREGLLVREETGVRVRSWDRWQESLDVESERRRKDRERKVRERAIARELSLVPSLDEPPSSLDASQDAVQKDPRTVYSKKPRIEVEVEVEETSSPRARRTRKADTDAPDVFPITESMRDWGRQHAPLVDGTKQTRQFLDHHRAKGSVFKDWTAAWRTWMGNAQSYAERDRAASGIVVNADPATEWKRMTR